MSVQFNVAIRAAVPGVTARIIASAPFDISRDRLPPRTKTPKEEGSNSGSTVTQNSREQRDGCDDQAEGGGREPPRAAS